MCSYIYNSSEIDECDSNPCENGATCEDQINAFVCHCTSNWYGMHCTEEHDDCSGNVTELCGRGTCVNEARSENGTASYSCACDEGWTHPVGEKECTIGEQI